MDAPCATATDAIESPCDPRSGGALAKPNARGGVATVAAIHLAPRQRQTLCFLLRGRAEKEIARELGLSINTVHQYVRSLYLLFSVSSRGELMARFLAPIIDQIEAGYIAAARPRGWQNNPAYWADSPHPGTVCRPRPSELNFRRCEATTAGPGEARRVHRVHGYFL